MSDRQRLRRDDDLDPARHASPPPDRRQSAETASILDLQGTAGNRAVASLLGPDAAASTLTTVQRDEKGGGDKGKGAAPGTMTIPDMKLALPIQSLQQQTHGPNRERDKGGDVTVTFAEKDFDPRLMKAMTDGKQFATIEIQIGNVKVTLKKVVLSGISMSGGTAVLQLNAAEIEFPTEDNVSEEERGY